MHINSHEAALTNQEKASCSVNQLYQLVAWDMIFNYMRLHHETSSIMDISSDSTAVGMAVFIFVQYIRSNVYNVD